MTVADTQASKASTAGQNFSSTGCLLIRALDRSARGTSYDKATKHGDLSDGPTNCPIIRHRTPMQKLLSSAIFSLCLEVKRKQNNTNVSMEHIMYTYSHKQTQYFLYLLHEFLPVFPRLSCRSSCRILLCSIRTNQPEGRRRNTAQNPGLLFILSTCFFLAVEQTYQGLYSPNVSLSAPPPCGSQNGEWCHDV